GTLAAAVRIGRRGRVDRGLDLYFLPRRDAVFPLALACVATHIAVAQLMRPTMYAAGFVLYVCCAGLSAAAGAAGPAGVTQTMTAQRLPSSAVSFVVLEADTGRVVMSHN